MASRCQWQPQTGADDTLLRPPFRDVTYTAPKSVSRGHFHPGWRVETQILPYLLQGLKQPKTADGPNADTLLTMQTLNIIVSVDNIKVYYRRI